MTSFSEQYSAGQIVELIGDNNLFVSNAIVLDFDPTRSKRRLIETSKAGRLTPDHWHVALQDPETDESLPAAIWESDRPEGRLGLHITREQVNLERISTPQVYTIDELEHRVGNIAMQVSQINCVCPE